MTTISSLQNPRVKDAARLRDRRHREKQGRILIDGARELARALDAGVRMLEVFVCEQLCTCPESLGLLERLPDWGAEILRVSPRVFGKLSFGHRVEGVLGVAEMPRLGLADLQLPERPLVAVLEGVEKPGNLGAVVRSADAAGFSAVIACDARTDLYNPNAIRASLGTIFALPVCAAGSGETLDWLRGGHLAIYAARVDAARLYTEVDYGAGAAMVLGSEAEGLSPAWSAEEVAPVRLPMLGVADSLNVSAAAAVLFYEARRQRATGRGPGRLGHSGGA